MYPFIYVKIFSLEKIFSDVQFLDYWKVHLSNSLILGVIWSLIPHVEQHPPISLQNEISSPICHEKLFLEKGLLYFTRNAMPLHHWKIMRGYMSPKYLWVSGLKLTNMLDLTKMRAVWQKNCLLSVSVVLWNSFGHSTKT